MESRTRPRGAGGAGRRATARARFRDARRRDRAAAARRGRVRPFRPRGAARTLGIEPEVQRYGDLRSPIFLDALVRDQRVRRRRDREERERERDESAASGRAHRGRSRACACAARETEWRGDRAARGRPSVTSLDRVASFHERGIGFPPVAATQRLFGFERASEGARAPPPGRHKRDARGDRRYRSRSVDRFERTRGVDRGSIEGGRARGSTRASEGSIVAGFERTRGKEEASSRCRRRGSR